MNISDLSQWIRSKSVIRFSKSAGPGGQNVNNVNTKVTLKLVLTDEYPSPLTPEDIARIREKLQNRISNAGEIVIQADSFRYQHRNRELAYKRLQELIISSIKKPKKRVKTKPSSAGRENRLSEKKRRSFTKSMRKPTQPEE